MAAPAIVPETGPSTRAQGNSHSTAQLGATPDRVNHEGWANVTSGTAKAEATQMGWE